MLLALFQIADFLLQILGWVIIAQVILSWLFAFNVLNTSSAGVRAVSNAMDRITEPFYRPVRKILPDFGGLDFSPLVVLLAVQVVRMLLGGLAADIAYPGA